MGDSCWVLVGDEMRMFGDGCWVLGGDEMRMFGDKSWLFCFWY